MVWDAQWPVCRLVRAGIVMIPGLLLFDSRDGADTHVVLIQHRDGSVTVRCANPLDVAKNAQEMADAEIDDVQCVVFLNASLEVVATARRMQ